MKKETILSLRKVMFGLLTALLFYGSFSEWVTAAQVIPFYFYGILATASFFGRKVATQMLSLSIIMAFLNILLLETPSFIDAGIWVLIAALYLKDK